MKAHFRIILVSLAAAALALPEITAAGGAVASPTKRAEQVQQAKDFLALQPVKLPAELANPFNPPNFAGAASHASSATATTGDGGTRTTPEQAAKPAGPKSDRDVLQEIAAGLKPGGFFTLGGNPILVFGQKRVKAGDHLTITFEGKEYTVEITSIKAPNFTLRLNREEFTRPIK
ncbi:MAG TPA: hypothetical protein VG936_03985 [Lacunisphaera sp.]|nr:hypothetical protein [Lacunisphaera sp.]